MIDRRIMNGIYVVVVVMVFVVRVNTSKNAGKNAGPVLVISFISTYAHGNTTRYISAKLLLKFWKFVSIVPLRADQY